MSCGECQSLKHCAYCECCRTFDFSYQPRTDIVADPLHADHGRGNADDGPDDPDCPCRGTVNQHPCAKSGCGFCRVADAVVAAQLEAAVNKDFPPIVVPPEFYEPEKK